MQPKKCNITGTIEISVTRPVTGSALEMFPVTDSSRTANMAGLASVSRINQNQGYPDSQSLVGQELSKLVESPTVNPSSLVPSNLLINIVSDTFQVFTNL